MAGNAFGKLLRVTTWGESHGPSIGCVLDGVPPGIPLTEADIQFYLDQRKPGQSRFTTQRREADQVNIVSGVFDGLTTGTALGLVIDNTDQRSADYSEIAQAFRPGHADYSYWKKYGLRDYRGGGRASARETAMRVAAGAVARKILNRDISGGLHIRGALVQMGPHKIDQTRYDPDHITQNPFWCPDPVVARDWAAFLDSVRKSGSSTGAVVEVIAQNVPVGLGSPLYDKLDADLAKAIMSINAVKAVEIGDGFAAAALSGEDNADEIRIVEGKTLFTSNHAGGILGGISSGQDIVVRFAVKPTSSILTPRKTITTQGQETELRTKGRHDPCVGIRAVPVGEAMVALTLADHLLRHKAQCG